MPDAGNAETPPWESSQANVGGSTGRNHYKIEKCCDRGCTGMEEAGLARVD